ncbi:MAG TPA: hypothetical protein VKU84_00535 [Stellaceae bacterium]|nr:hypothetical protein [Stellaceae bacterium]
MDAGGRPRHLTDVLRERGEPVDKIERSLPELERLIAGTAENDDLRDAIRARLALFVWLHRENDLTGARAAQLRAVEVALGQLVDVLKGIDDDGRSRLRDCAPLSPEIEELLAARGLRDETVVGIESAHRKIVARLAGFDGINEASGRVLGRFSRSTDRGPLLAEMVALNAHFLAVSRALRPKRGPRPDFAYWLLRETAMNLWTQATGGEPEGRAFSKFIREMVRVAFDLVGAPEPDPEELRAHLKRQRGRKHSRKADKFRAPKGRKLSR